MSTPWIAYSQTHMYPNSVKLNPSTFSNGLLGEASLPYTVPAGKVLHLKKLEVEPLWGAAMIPYIGDSTSTTSMEPNNISLNTYSAGGVNNGQDNDSNIYTTPMTADTIIESKVWDCDYYIPAGKKLNLRFSVGPNPGPNDSWIYGWAMSGELLDA